MKNRTPASGRRAWASALFLAVTGPALAAPPTDTKAPSPIVRADASRAEETMIVTGTLRPTRLAAAPGNVTVIEGRELELRQLDGALDALRHVPGIHADQPGARGSRASVYTRGLDPNHTQVLVDGILLNDPTNARGGSFDFATLGTDAVDRIEVARGALSAVYGSDALAGAIQVITRDGRGPDRASVEARGGRFGTHLVRASFGGERGPFDLAVTASLADEDEPENIGTYSGTALHSKLGFDFGETGRAEAVVRATESRASSFPEFSGGPRFAVRRAFEERDVHELASGLSLVFDPLSWLRTELRFSSQLRREERHSPGVAPDASNPFGTERPVELETTQRLQHYNALAKWTAQLPHGLALVFGGSARYEEGQTRGRFDLSFLPFPLPADFTIDRVIGGPFAELHWDGPLGIAATVGTRFDATDEGQSEWSPRVALRVPLAEMLALETSEIDLHFSWGEGFKLPSFYALAEPTVGDRQLRSERSKGGDLGVQLALFDRRVALSVTGFALEVDNLIDFDVVTSRLVNLDQVRSRGVEFGLTLTPWDTLELNAHATYLFLRDENDRKLRRRPTWRGGFTLAWSPIPTLSTRVTALFVDDVLDASVPTTAANPVMLGDWARVDLALEWRPVEAVALTLAVDNVLDAEYEEAVGVPAVSIRPRAGIRLTY